jgi:uncharacterized protein (DUF1697 family)
VALVVLLNGVNVGGHRPLRPTILAEELRHLDVVNIGAAGTFVIRKRVSRAELRAHIARRLPFEAEITICDGREILGMLSQNFFAGYPIRPDVIRFLSVMSRRPRLTPRLPMNLPSEAEWLLKVLACQGRFFVGLYRRQRRVISYLGRLDRTFGVPLTTRNWNTITSIAKVLNREDSH